MATSNRALGLIRVGATIAMLASLAGLLRMAWDWWDGADTLFWVREYTLTFGTVGIVAELVALYWRRHRGFALVTVATAALFCVALSKMRAAVLADISHQLSDTSWWRWAIVGFGMLWIWWTAFVGVLEIKARRRRQSLAAGSE